MSLGPIHPKAKGAGLGGLLSGAVVWALGRYVFHGTVDPVVQGEVYALVSGFLSIAGAWLAPNRPRAVPVGPGERVEFRRGVASIAVEARGGGGAGGGSYGSDVTIATGGPVSPDAGNLGGTGEVRIVPAPAPVPPPSPEEGTK